jgi:hypothetical protein
VIAKLVAALLVTQPAGNQPIQGKVEVLWLGHGVPHRHARQLPAPRCFEVVGQCLELAKDRFGCRIVEFSVQGNHIHLLLRQSTASLSAAACRVW